jgi:hypothetical protein
MCMIMVMFPIYIDTSTTDNRSILETPTNNARALYKKQFYLEYGIFIDISKV